MTVVIDFDTTDDILFDLADDLLLQANHSGSLYVTAPASAKVGQTAILTGTSHIGAGVEFLNRGNIRADVFLQGDNSVMYNYFKVNADQGIHLDGALTILFNSGTSNGSEYGASITGSEARLVNRGLMTGDVYGVEVLDGSDATIRNFKRLGTEGESLVAVHKSINPDAPIDTEFSGLSLNNTRFVFGDIILEGDGRDVVINKGVIDGDISFGGGDDVYKAQRNKNVTEDGINSVFGGDGNDRIFGSRNTEYLFGDDGKDLIRTGGGDDIVNGGNGNDKIVAEGVGESFQTLIGGDGDDVMLNKGGVDTVVIFNGGEGNDRFFGNGNFEIAFYTGAQPDGIDRLKAVDAAEFGGDDSILILDGLYSSAAEPDMIG